MKTPFTDALIVIVHADGKAFPVVPASVSQMLERRLEPLKLSQDVAWGIIRMSNWESQSPEWRNAARHWQEDLYIQPELPMTYSPGPRPQSIEETPDTLPEALKLIAELRQEQHALEIRFNNAEKVLEELETIVATFENETYARTVQQN